MGVDRGLLEEETSTAKKTANMAADDCIIYLHDKRARIASLFEIKWLLVDIQIEIGSILT